MTPSITAQTTARLSVPTPSIHSGSNKIVHSTVTNVEVGFVILGIIIWKTIRMKGLDWLECIEILSVMCKGKYYLAKHSQLKYSLYKKASFKSFNMNVLSKVSNG